MTRAERYRANLDALDFCTGEYSIDVTPLTEFQFRFTCGGAIWDFYPKSGKINQVGTTRYEVVDLREWMKNKTKHA